MESILQDLRYAVRTLIKNRGFTLIAVITLALGIGANTAIFTVVNAALLRGLPYREPERLMHLWETKPQQDFPRREASYPDFLDWQQNNSFEAMAAYGGAEDSTIAGAGTPERVLSANVTANFFQTLGVTPLLGRVFDSDEDTPAAHPVVILSFGLWQRRFGGEASVLSKSVTIDGTPTAVVGILPAGFQFAPRGGAELWMPLRVDERVASRRFMHWVNVVARLRPGVTQDQASSEMSTIARRIEKDYPDSHAGTGISLTPLHEQFTGDIKPILLALLGAVAVVLLIGCANVANLLLVRCSVRQKELAIRAAIGAGRMRLVRQLLTESLMLSAAGGVVGFALAQWGVGLLISAIPETRLNSMPYLAGISIDWRILGFVAALSVVTGVMFGVIPAIQASRVNVVDSLKETGKSIAPPHRRVLKSTLVVTEVALSLVLLSGAGLMITSLLKLLDVRAGFRVENVLTFRASALEEKYPDANQRVLWRTQVLDRLKAAPGAVDAASINVLPLRGGNTIKFIVEGEPFPTSGQEIESNLRDISLNYFSVMDVPLVAGRFFTEQDGANAPLAIIVNKTLAEVALPGSEAVGRVLHFSGDNLEATIVGVVGDEKVNGLDAKTSPVVYYLFSQDPMPAVDTSFVVRTSVPPAATIPGVRAAVAAVDSDAVLYNVATMDRLMTESPAAFARRYPAMLIGGFAILALVLASIGLYGVVSNTVAQQTHEIGIRMALGGRRWDIIKLVVGRNLVLIAGGLVAGVAGSLVATKLLSSILFGVSPTDPATLAMSSLLLAGVALFSSFLPAARAAMVDPMIALRYE